MPLSPAVDKQDAHILKRLTKVGMLQNVELKQRQVDLHSALEIVLQASLDHDLIVTGATPRKRTRFLTFGTLQDALIHKAQADVLVIASEREQFNAATVQRILVPTNGLEYSMAAGDIAAYLALGYDAELMILHVVSPAMDAIFWRERDHQQLRLHGEGVVAELAFRVKRLGVRVSTRVVVGERAGTEILREIKHGTYDLVVLGAMDRGMDGRPYLGRTIQRVITQGQTPTALLVTHQK